ncbi:MAG: stage VI sporulation protein F [Bacilli bacterium]|nr:stage VI sporulation protein F [Bacilli bacterium]
MNNELLDKVEAKTNVSKDTLTLLAKKIEDSNLTDESVLRDVIKTLSKITNKDVSKEREDKIINAIMNNKIPNNIDKFF